MGLFFVVKIEYYFYLCALIVFVIINVKFLTKNFQMKKNLFFFAVLCLFIVSCKNTDEVDSPEMYKYVNEWLHDNMTAVYYWNTELPYYKSSTDKPSVYFKSLINKEDRFSAIFESYEKIKNELNGVIASEVGFEFKLFRETDSNENVVALVLYTKPGTPARTLGIKRGDIIRRINNQQMTMTNYRTVIASLSDVTPSVSITFSDYTNNIFTDKTPVVVNKVNGYNENPVFLDTVYTFQTKKIGYLVYNFFTNDPGDKTMKYDLELNAAIGQFKQQNITDLVVDLRYNHGGMMSSAINFASMLVPNLTTNKVFSYTEYNRNYTDYFNSSSFKSQYPNENPFSDNFATTIDLPSPKTDKIPVQNIGNSLQRIYFLIGDGTASASEMVINGIKPFLPCILVGDTTVGKNVGSTLINDEKNTKNQWAFMPIVLRYFNKDRQSDFTKGFVPNYYIEDDFKHQLGDINEALLAKAISQITGIAQATAAKAPIVQQAWKQELPYKTERHFLIVKNKATDLYINRTK